MRCFTSIKEIWKNLKPEKYTMNITQHIYGSNRMGEAHIKYCNGCGSFTKVVILEYVDSEFCKLNTIIGVGTMGVVGERAHPPTIFTSLINDNWG